MANIITGFIKFFNLMTAFMAIHLNGFLSMSGTEFHICFRTTSVSVTFMTKL